ncbi:MAG: hypothetical protein H0V73_04005 [Chloroflexi bacterium]|nr:hypothetical protein [Chloroflexota bacterium]
MLASDAASAAATWRPQLFGDRRANAIADPIIEPLWTGPRVLALVENGTVSLTDAEGRTLDGHHDLAKAFVEATGGATALIEAFLTDEPIQATSAIAGRDSISMPKPGQAMTQMIIGTRGDRKDRLAQRQQEEARRRTVGADDEVALVAVDLLWIDDDSLCDVPLLERKRILESVVVESHLIRVGIHVKPPIDTWLGSWRSFGFRRMSYKAANSRYVPGQKNQEWSLAAIPAR